MFMNEPNSLIIDNKPILNQLEDILSEINRPLFPSAPKIYGEYYTDFEENIIDLSAISKLKSEDLSSIFKLINSIQNIQSFRMAFSWNVIRMRGIGYGFEFKGPSEIRSICYILPLFLEFFIHKEAFRDILKTGIKKNEFGQVDKAGWHKKFIDFFCDFLQPYFDRYKGSLKKVIKNPRFRENRFINAIDQVIHIYNNISEMYIYLTERYFSLSEDLEETSNREKGLSMEQDCMDILKKNGWKVRKTPPSNDQGADLIAERGVLKLILQCKNHKSAVGNEGVQQVLAAKSFYSGTLSAVVSKSGFTSSASQIAEKTDVMLLTMKDLREI